MLKNANLTVASSAEQIISRRRKKLGMHLSKLTEFLFCFVLGKTAFRGPGVSRHNVNNEGQKNIFELYERLLSINLTMTARIYF